MATVLTRKSSKEIIDDLIRRAFEEDVKSGDVTTNAILDAHSRTKGGWTSKDEGIVAGLDVAGEVFKKLDADIDWIPQVDDGDTVSKGEQLVVMEGKARAMLTAERIALNIAQRMSGIATTTRRYVQAVEAFDTQILDTRKTAPGLRLLDKYAVEAGGGQNHRMGLYDLAMIKDNHIVAAGSITSAVKKVRSSDSKIKIEVETKTIKEVKEALVANADIIMLDNMTVDLMAEAVNLIGGRAKTEASGGITINTIQNVAGTGVDFISVGALTHSVDAFDISQQLDEIF